MAQPIARDAEDFARLMLRMVARLGERGDWVPARDAYERTVAEHPGHAYLGHIAAKPGRRIGLSAITERLRAAEFPAIERRKAGARQNAPVLYRVGPAPVALDLQLPQDVPPNHPLVAKRRTVGARSGSASSARRAALTERAARAPWRRRLLPRASGAAQGVESALRALRRSWQRGLLARTTGVANSTESTVRTLRRWWRQLRALGLTLAAGLVGR